MKYLLFIIVLFSTNIHISAQDSRPNDHTIDGAIHITEATLLSNLTVPSGVNENLESFCFSTNESRVMFKFKSTDSENKTITFTYVNQGSGNDGWGCVLYKSSKDLDAKVLSDLAEVDCNSGGYENYTKTIEPGQAYYLAYNVSSDELFGINITTTATLPVELVNFYSEIINNKIHLFWQTATEINNYGFEIERSSFQANGTTPVRTDWKTIGFVEGHGNSNSPKSYSFIEDNLPSGLQPTDELEYRLKQIDTDGTYKYYSTTTKVDLSFITSVNSTNLPVEFSLKPNYPNPFNPSTVISYSIATPSQVKLNIFDLQGKNITSLVNEFQNAGNYEITFNASTLSSGIYFYDLKAVNAQNTIIFTDNKKMILIK